MLLKTEYIKTFKTREKFFEVVPEAKEYFEKHNPELLEEEYGLESYLEAYYDTLEGTYYIEPGCKDEWTVRLVLEDCINKESIKHSVSKALEYQFSVYSWDEMLNDCELDEKERDWAKANLTYAVVEV